MPAVSADYQLKPDQNLQPVLWLHWRELGDLAPDPRALWKALTTALGEGRSKRVKSWGHAGERNAHWLVTRGGLGLHIDASYARYTHHLIVRNDGYRLCGLQDLGVDAIPPLIPGAFYVLDTHSPHQVRRDPRIDTGNVWKVQVAVDADEILTPEQVWEACTAKLADDPGDGAENVPRTPPRTGKA